MLPPIFCIHYSKLAYRKEYCDRLFNEHSLNVIWVENYDPEKLDLMHYPITLQEYSLIKKTLHVFDILTQESIPYAIVLEDDNIIPPYMNFKKFIEMCFIEFKSTHGDILYMGGTRDHEVKLTMPNKLIYYNDTYCSRGTHAYMINVKCVPTVINSIDYTLPLDHAFNKVIRDKNLKTGWTSPYIEQWTDLHIKQWPSAIHK